MIEFSLPSIKSPKLPNLPKIDKPDLSEVKEKVGGMAQGAQQKLKETAGAGARVITAGAEKAGQVGQAAGRAAASARDALVSTAKTAGEKGEEFAASAGGKVLEVGSRGAEFVSAIMEGKEMMAKPEEVAAYTEFLKSITQLEHSDKPMVRIEAILSHPLGKAILTGLAIKSGAKLVLAGVSAGKLALVADFALNQADKLLIPADEVQRQNIESCTRQTVAALMGLSPDNKIAGFLNPSQFSQENLKRATHVLGPILDMVSAKLRPGYPTAKA